MHRSIVWFVAIFAVGCGWASSAQYSLGPYRMSEEALYERAVRTVTAEGYQLHSADQERGTLIVSANYRHPAYPEPHRFTIQCYQEGWIQVTPSGPLVRRQNE